jgi:6-pyruvoyltetrahydropterin/6-carboxytetrahydropterin synthase
VQIRKSFTFEAAHVLPNHPGKCSRLHGHSYRLEVALEGPLHQTGPAAGMVEDFEVVSRVVKAAVVNELDHRSLNELLPNPTAENIVVWIWERLAPELPTLAELTLWETRKACVVIKKGDALIQTGNGPEDPNHKDRSPNPS